jgi:hypothetical protein
MRSGDTEQTELSLQSRDLNEKQRNGAWRQNDPEQDFAVRIEQCTVHELQAHNCYTHELPGEEVSGRKSPVHELCSHEFQVHELYTPESELYHFQPQELPAESVLDQTNSIQRQPNNLQSFPDTNRVEFENKIAILQATIAVRDQEIARLRQRKDTADFGRAETRRETETARAEAAAREKALRKADTRILNLKAKVKTLESANDILYAELRAWKAGAYSARRTEGPKSLLEERVALDELCERHLVQEDVCQGDENLSCEV